MRRPDPDGNSPQRFSKHFAERLERACDDHRAVAALRERVSGVRLGRRGSRGPAHGAVDFVICLASGILDH